MIRQFHVSAQGQMPQSARISLWKTSGPRPIAHPKVQIVFLQVGSTQGEGSGIMWAQGMMEGSVAFQNWKVAIRVLFRSPLFALTAIVTIALGIGASTAIFSVTNAVLLQPLPYKDADRLVFAGMELRQRHLRDLPFSNADFIDMRDGAKSAFEDYAGVFTFRQIVLHDDGTREEAKLAIATTNFFRMLGGKVLIGRDFQDEDGAPQPAA